MDQYNPPPIHIITKPCHAQLCPIAGSGSAIRSEENPINFYADISHASEKEIDWRNTIEKDMGAVHRHCNESMKAHHWCLANSSGYITFLGAWYCHCL